MPILLSPSSQAFADLKKAMPAGGGSRQDSSSAQLRDILIVCKALGLHTLCATAKSRFAVEDMDLKQATSRYIQNAANWLEFAPHQFPANMAERSQWRVAMDIGIHFGCYDGVDLLKHIEPA